MNGLAGFDAELIMDGGIPVVVVRGELDMLAAPKLASVLRSALADRPETLALNLGGVDFIDAAGVRVLTTAATEAIVAGTRLVLRSASPASAGCCTCWSSIRS